MLPMSCQFVGRVKACAARCRPAICPAQLRRVCDASDASCASFSAHRYFHQHRTRLPHGIARYHPTCALIRKRVLSMAWSRMPRKRNCRRRRRRRKSRSAAWSVGVGDTSYTGDTDFRPPWSSRGLTNNRLEETLRLPYRSDHQSRRAVGRVKPDANHKGTLDLGFRRLSPDLRRIRLEAGAGLAYGSDQRQIDRRLSCTRVWQVGLFSG
jgi:hypothetical protein